MRLGRIQELAEIGGGPEGGHGLLRQVHGVAELLAAHHELDLADAQLDLMPGEPFLLRFQELIPQFQKFAVLRLSFQACLDGARCFLESIGLESSPSLVQRLSRRQLTIDGGLLGARILEEARQIGVSRMLGKQAPGPPQNLRIVLLAYELLDRSNVVLKLFCFGVFFLLLADHGAQFLNHGVLRMRRAEGFEKRGGLVKPR